MAEKCRITVELPLKSYNMIRTRSETSDTKTARVVSRYLFQFLKILADGEASLFRKFSSKQGRAMAETLYRVHVADAIDWEDLAMYPAENLGELLRVFECDSCVPLATVAGLGTGEILALMEYARLWEDPVRFEMQTARFRA